MPGLLLLLRVNRRSSCSEKAAGDIPPPSVSGRVPHGDPPRLAVPHMEQEGMPFCSLQISAPDPPVSYSRPGSLRRSWLLKAAHLKCPCRRADTLPCHPPPLFCLPIAPTFPCNSECAQFLLVFSACYPPNKCPLQMGSSPGLESCGPCDRHM